MRDLDVSEEDAAICKAIIALAQTLKLKVVAEGVENKAQLAFLQEARCDLLQGYFISKPLNRKMERGFAGAAGSCHPVCDPVEISPCTCLHPPWGYQRSKYIP